jgi:hypothetical protein
MARLLPEIGHLPITATDEICSTSGSVWAWGKRLSPELCSE